MTEFPNIFPTIEDCRAQLRVNPRDPHTIAVMVATARVFLSDGFICDETWTSPPPGPEAEIENRKRFWRGLELASANLEAGTFDILVNLAASMLRNHKQMPEFLETFASKVLSGEIKRPTKRGPKKFNNGEKLWRATELVSGLFGVPLYVGHELFTGVTAAEIISLAAGRGVNAVVNACKNGRRELGAK